MKKAKLVILDIPYAKKYKTASFPGTWSDYLIRCIECDTEWWFRKGPFNIYKCTKCNTYFGDLGQRFYSKQEISENGVFFQHKEDKLKVFIEDIEFDETEPNDN